MATNKDGNDPPEHPAMESLRELERRAAAQQEEDHAQERARRGLPPVAGPRYLLPGQRLRSTNRISKPSTGRVNAATGRGVSAKERRERLAAAADAALAVDPETSHSAPSSNPSAGRTASATSKPASNSRRAAPSATHTSQHATAVADDDGAGRGGSSSARTIQIKSRKAANNRQGTLTGASSTQESDDVSGTVQPLSELQHEHSCKASSPAEGILQAEFSQMASILTSSLTQTVSQSMGRFVADMAAKADEQSAKIARIEAESQRHFSKARDAQRETEARLIQVENEQRKNEARFSQTENAFQAHSQQLQASHDMIHHLHVRVSSETRGIRAAITDQAQSISQSPGELRQVTQIHQENMNKLGEAQQQYQRDVALNTDRVVMVASKTLHPEADIHLLAQQLVGVQAQIQGLNALRAPSQVLYVEAPQHQSSSDSAPLRGIEYPDTGVAWSTQPSLAPPSGPTGQPVMMPWSSLGASHDDVDLLEHPLAPCRRDIAKEQAAWVEKRQDLVRTYSDGEEELQVRVGTVIAPYDVGRSQLRDRPKFDSVRKTLADFGLNAHRYFEFVLIEAEKEISKIWRECDEAIQYTLRDGRIDDEQLRAEFEEHRSRASKLVSDGIPRELGVILERFKTTYLDFFRQWPKPASKDHQAEFLQQWRPAHDQLIKMLSLDEPRYAEHHRLPTTDEAFRVATAMQPLAITASTDLP
ncbi:hypothetical protein G647_03376 [Cladophialophora carrionii CBS 160.54]|uniref:Uncharacterized protein n=1 Tax=Cladophialophora carrionii CBS 160.54 TaxID=1279043 RepID=V9DJV5_9EURO|nr:uncharacterized protein G647_03376 [Cladophialophora carrionii CBS 160.54]ETI26598.1 hypothetical protein G647_03376 [Cladophialophora carrionii CBS 160.54]